MKIFVWSRRDGRGIPFVSVAANVKPPYDVSDKEKYVVSQTELSGLTHGDVTQRELEAATAMKYRRKSLIDSLPIDTQVIISPLFRRMEGLEIELAITTMRLERQSETILRHAALIDELKSKADA